MKQLIETIENLRVRGIGFHSLTEALDTTTAQGRLVFHMFGALADDAERVIMRSRALYSDRTAARRAGRTGGRPPKLTDDIEADIGVTQIAHRLGVRSGDALPLYPRRANREYPRITVTYERQ
jgi:DNA invertase Pin-like site-specific DNA recombinase